MEVNSIFKILALYGTPTWESYVTGILPKLRSVNIDYYHSINGLLGMYRDGNLTQDIVRKTVLDICNEINERPV